MWITTLDGNWYVCEIRGAVFLTWVNEADRANAAVFHESKAREWLDLLETMSGMTLKAVPTQSNER